jgi:hypothetical protein
MIDLPTDPQTETLKNMMSWTKNLLPNYELALKFSQEENICNRSHAIEWIKKVRLSSHTSLVGLLRTPLIPIGSGGRLSGSERPVRPNI